jgi:hypothetical protein
VLRRRSRLGDDFRKNRNVTLSCRAGRVIAFQKRIGFSQQVV